jgi:hypothetical protein
MGSLLSAAGSLCPQPMTYFCWIQLLHRKLMKLNSRVLFWLDLEVNFLAVRKLTEFDSSPSGNKIVHDTIFNVSNSS